ncbi:MAG: sarcosine oxidase subunit delta [Hyphomicrobiales bacterium]|nr:sarcosine oxidase subunit delta [Hyphomicrobiales bacterium]
MRITCPYCGLRPFEEYTYLGDASKNRPTSNDPSTMEAWYDYLYLRDNPRGRMKEYWQHSSGCRSWLVVDRNTDTHEIFAVEAARDFIRRRKA